MAMVLLGNLSWHPAVTAWRDVAPTAPTPDRIEVLRRRNGTAVYRLVGAGPNGGPIIARRLGRARALVERMVYTTVLSRLPGAGRYCAFRLEGADYAWVFLAEDR